MEILDEDFEYKKEYKVMFKDEEIKELKERKRF
jgi:hypothetical protein